VSFVIVRLKVRTEVYIRTKTCCARAALAAEVTRYAARSNSSLSSLVVSIQQRRTDWSAEDGRRPRSARRPACPLRSAQCPAFNYRPLRTPHRAAERLRPGTNASSRLAALVVGANKRRSACFCSRSPSADDPRYDSARDIRTNDACSSATAPASLTCAHPSRVIPTTSAAAALAQRT